MCPSRDNSGRCPWMTIRSKQWYTKTSSFPNRERNVSIGRLLVFLLLQQDLRSDGRWNQIHRPATKSIPWDFQGRAALGYELEHAGFFNHQLAFIRIERRHHAQRQRQLVVGVPEGQPREHWYTQLPQNLVQYLAEGQRRVERRLVIPRTAQVALAKHQSRSAVQLPR